MGAVYADLEDVALLGRALTAGEQEKTEALLVSASALLRQECRKRGHDLDSDISENEDLGEIAKTITVAAVLRALNAAQSPQDVTQGTQSGLGYSVSYTYLNAGQSLYFMRNELKQLGLMRQFTGVMEVYDVGDDTGE